MKILSIDSERILTEDTVRSEDTGLTNKEMWTHLQNIFDIKSLFDEVDFSAIYNGDKLMEARNAALLLDLRLQCLVIYLDLQPNDLVAHRYYIESIVWKIRFEEIVGLYGLIDLVRQGVKVH